MTMIHQTKALEARDYRRSANGHWRRKYDAQGGALTEHEQRINALGGRDYGPDTAAVLAAEALDVAASLAGFAADEIAASADLRAAADWLAATARQD